MAQHILVHGLMREEPDLRALVAALLLLTDQLSAEELKELSREETAQPQEAA